MGLRKYKVLSIKRDTHIGYKPGEIISLSEDEAKRLKGKCKLVETASTSPPERRG